MLQGIPCITVTIFLWMSVSASPTCPGNNITIRNPVTGHVQCQKCLVCPVGQGLSVNCGDVITPQTAIVCKPCEQGMTYSSKSEAGACKTCTNCGEYRETIKSCTLTSNAVRGKNCKLGAYPEGMVGMCRPCSACCNDGNDIFEPQCLVPRVPKNKQCSELRSEKCSKKIASVRVNTTVEENHPASSPSTHTGLRMSPPVTRRAAQDSAFTNDVPLSNGAIIGIVVGLVFVVLILPTVIFIVKTRRKWQPCEKADDKDREMQRATEAKEESGECNRKEERDEAGSPVPRIGGVEETGQPGPHSSSGEVLEVICKVTRFTVPELIE